MPAEATAVEGPPTRQRPYEFVRDDGRRADGINDLFNRFTGRSRSRAEYDWEFYQCLEPGAHIWAIVEVASGKVVGHHGIVPTPMCVDGAVVLGGRTENTIIEQEVRAKIFYPGMEKKAFKEVLRSLALLYTIHNQGPQGRIRERLGYVPVGRWNVFLPTIGGGYFTPLLARLRDRYLPWLPTAIVRLAAAAIGTVTAAVRALQHAPQSSTCVEVTDIDAFEAEYREFWAEARGGYDVTIDRTWEFLHWRVFSNPNLRFRVWTVRVGGRLEGVIIGHRHRLGTASAHYVDDVLVRRYAVDEFVEVLRWLPFVDPDADATVVMTLDTPTPLRAALHRQFPLQSRILERFGVRLFDQLVAFDRDGVCTGRRWFVTPIFTEGLDTSRPDATVTSLGS